MDAQTQTAPEPAIRGYKAIASLLTELWGVDVSKDAAYRLATRKADPLPTDGYDGRVWTRRSAVVAWVEAERARRRRAALPGDKQQLDLFGAAPDATDPAP